MQNRILPVILSRFDSSRLYGKALMTLPTGETLIDAIIAQLALLIEKNLIAQPVLATSTREVDDPIANYCNRMAIDVYRGSFSNVLGRILEAGKRAGFPYVMRLNGDSPFLDFDLISLAVESLQTEDYDVVTNLYPRSFPYGITLQILSVSTLTSLIERFPPNSQEQEHITPYIERHTDKLKIRNIEDIGEETHRLRLTVDTEADFLKISDFIRRLGVNTLRDLTWRSLSELSDK